MILDQYYQRKGLESSVVILAWVIPTLAIMVGIAILDHFHIITLPTWWAR